MSKIERYHKGKIYERQKSESDKAWDAFVIFRELGSGRTLIAAARQYRKKYALENSQPRTTERYLSTWCNDFAWRERARDYDADIDAHRRKLAFEEVEKMREKHVQLAQSVQALVAIELRKVIKRAQLKANEDTPVISLSDLLKAMDSGVKLERTSRDMPDSITEDRSELTLFKGDDPRERLRPLLKDPEAMAAVNVLNKKIDEENEQ